MSSFDFIDRIIIFNEVTPIKLIKKIKPKYIFKGDDYTEEQVIGNKEIKEWAGKVILIKCVEGKSTSKIIEGLKMDLSAVLFDVDGTIAETEDFHRKSFNEAFKEFNLDWFWDEAIYKELINIGGGKERIMYHIKKLGQKC